MFARRRQTVLVSVIDGFSIDLRNPTILDGHTSLRRDAGNDGMTCTRDTDSLAIAEGKIIGLGTEAASCRFPIL